MNYRLTYFTGTFDEGITNSLGTDDQDAPGSGLGISQDGFVFPLRTTKGTITGNLGEKWCYQSQENCHHDYNAADIFAPTGTAVVAARGGTVVRAADNDGSNVGSRVTIKGEDGNLYYYAHMGDGTIKVEAGQIVEAGDELGRVGTTADAVGTAQHLHFDVLPPSYDARPSCSGSICSTYPFINPQPALTQSFGALP
jgi:murein DD-endopeptidase MepM/ murein hydrolase activator NlpD